MAHRFLRRSPCLLLLAGLTWSAPISAQPPPPPPTPQEVSAAELRTAQTAIAREIGAENWVAADAVLDPLEDRLTALEDWQHLAQLGCERAVLHLRQPHAMTTDYLREVRQDAGNGLASATAEDRRFECYRLVGLSFAHYAEIPDLEPAVRRMALESATVFLSRARASRDSAGLTQSYQAIAAEVRQDVETLTSALRGQPVARAVGPQPTAEALAAAIQRATWLQNPLRQASCGVDPDVAPSDGALTIVCVYEAYPLRGLSSLHPMERFFVQPSEGTFRAVGMMRDSDLRDGVAGAIYEVRAFQRLAAARHGIDGILYSWREGFELAGERRIESFVTVCDSTTGLCQRLDIGRDTCTADARGRPQCSEGWEADPSVQGGQLVLARARRPRRGARRDPMPTDLELRHDLRRQFGVNATREGTPMLVPDPPIGRHCRLVIQGRAAVAARTEPTVRASSAGNVPAESVVVPTDRRLGWVRIAAPVSGWVQSRSVARVCD